ncbi:MAG: diversity-generating retroelement protein Avd [Nitrospirae bacterium]|nr:diversity-generating retroelement protein Avd [Nitrospirota bacterium]
MKENYPIFEKWTKILDWILATVEKYPKNARFTISTKIANMALEVMEKIIEAIYTKNRLYILQSINLYIEKLRVFFRISMERRYISIRQYEYIINELNETGMMVGGWLKVETNRKSIPADN